VAVKFKTDENLPNAAVAILRAAGHNVTTVLEEELGGAADPRVAQICRTEQRALITLDRGLGDIRAYPPADYHGIVVLRPRDQGIDAIVALIQRIGPLLESHSLVGTLWIVDERRVRVRS